jgi:ATPase subunit of ABC transporter with duplicated ATPase domains
LRLHVADVSKHYGAQTVLEHVTLSVDAGARIGVVGPNGVGKSTLLRLLAGREEPDGGRVSRTPVSGTVGYLAQEPERRRGEPILAALARQTGVAAAEAELQRSAEEFARDSSAAHRYSAALERFLSLGGDDFHARARTACADLGLSLDLASPGDELSGGEAARAALAAILLSRFDLLLLDEPTNNLDFEGLERLERFLGSYPGGLAVVSHDRALLDRVAVRIVELDPSSHGIREWAGGWSDYAAARERERQAAYAEFEQAVERRRHVAELLAKRRTEARGKGASLGKRTGGADRRATRALETKVRQTERLLERNELPETPFEPWELRLSLGGGRRPSDVVLRLERAVVGRGEFRLGPVELDLVPGERVAVTGRNGTGKSTLLAALAGALPVLEGRRIVGRRTTIGELGQHRTAYAGDASFLETFRAHSGLETEPARTLLAKFGLGAEHVARPCSALSPGERTRAHLAELQSRQVNLLLLDEPTNHLDIDAIEQLEAALGSYEGTLVVVSHDRRFLESVSPTREFALEPL